MIVGKPDGLGVELIEVRRLKPRIAVGAKVAGALVVGQDEDDIGWGVRRADDGAGCEEGQQSEEEGDSLTHEKNLD
jgi:hypothetical protein